MTIGPITFEAHVIQGLMSDVFKIGKIIVKLLINSTEGPAIRAQGIVLTDRRTESTKGTLEDAVAIAANVHRGQTDKAGAPYLLHPLRLMMRMKSPSSMIVAVLHDVVEDSDANDKWTIERLREVGFSEDVLNAVECVTKRENEDYDDFIDRSSCNDLAREVKLADLEDNLNTLRIEELQEKDLKRIEKYHRSWKRLAATNGSREKI